MLELLKTIFEGTTVFGEPGNPDTPLHAQVTPGAGKGKVAIVVGSNASGKSLAVRLIGSWLNGEKPKVEPLQVSMRYRTMMGMHKAFMYGPFGDEQDSTGAVSMGAIEGGLMTARGRETPCWLLLDEPDVGLSEDFTYALGEHLARSANEGLGAKCGGLVVVTHSRELVNGMVENLAAAPHFVHVDDNPQTLTEWLAGRRRRSVEELLALRTKSVEVHRKLMPFFKD